MTVLARLRRFAGNHLPVATRADLRAARHRARQFASAYRRLAAAVDDRPYRSEREPGPPNRDEVATAAERARVTDAQAGLFERLTSGASLEAASAETVRDLIKAGRVTASASFAEALAAREETATAGHLAAAIVADHRKLPELATAEFAHVPAEVWQAHATAEYLEAAYRTAPERAREVISDLLAERTVVLGPRGWYDVLAYAFATGGIEQAGQAFDILDERAEAEPDAWHGAAQEIAWLRGWMRPGDGGAVDGHRGKDPEGHIPFALLDYRQPSKAKTSQNIGDHIQTLASLGHLARHTNVRFRGEGELAEFAREMQQRVRAEHTLDTPPQDVTLLTAQRDSSTAQNFPEGTWAFVFGWFMHPLFGLRHDFPPHPNLRPILVSFHCNKRELLTAEAIDYLRRYGPVGCRDWTTVDLLLSVDVPAFFSGCLTTTVDTLFPQAGSGQREQRDATVYVDMPDGSVPAGAERVAHSDPQVKERTLGGNLRRAADLLDDYRARFSRMVTSRLHSYLPARSLGLDVRFLPKNRADVRFGGLIDIEDTAFNAIRDGMLDRLEQVTTALLSGKPEDEVYRLWRDLCADDVAAARQRHEAVTALPSPSVDAPGIAARVRALGTGPARHAASQTVDIVMPVSRSDLGTVPHTLTSALATASRPVRLTVLAWECGAKQREWLDWSVGDADVAWLPCDDLPQGAWPILLPELFPELDRVTVLPAVAALPGDIAELAERDLAGSPLAARSSLGTRETSGFGVFYRAARRLHPDADAAQDLYRRMHARHVFDFDAFFTEVMVLDLARMRTDEVASRFVPYNEHFGLTAAEVLTAYAGPDRAVLPARWAHIPTHERVHDPQLVYWPGTAKPWQGRVVAGQEYWAGRG